MRGSDGGDISDVQQTILPGAKLGDLSMGDFPFVVTDNAAQPKATGAKVEMSQPLPGDGALTYEAFANRLVQFDYSNHQLQISEPLKDAAWCARACGDLTVKHFGKFGPVTITTNGFTLNGRPVIAQIDTLFKGTMLVYPDSVDKYLFKKEKKGKGRKVFPFTQNGIETIEVPGVSFAFRDLELIHAAPLYLTTNDENYTNMQFDATVGLALLEHAKVTFDFKGNHMWLEAASSSR